MSETSPLTPWHPVGRDDDETITRSSADSSVQITAFRGRRCHITVADFSVQFNPEVIAEAARCCIRAGLLTAEELVP